MADNKNKPAVKESKGSKSGKKLAPKKELSKTVTLCAIR